MPHMKLDAPSFIGRAGRTVSALAGAMLMMVSGNAIAQPPASPKPETDAQVQQRLERIIQKCIRDRTASPYICRATAYATALAEGYPPERAARLTNFDRSRMGQ